MRNPIEVTLRIANVVPDEFKARFAHLARDFSYKAPEQCAECFAKLGIMCNGLLDDCTFEHDWQVEMISVLTIRSKEELLAPWKEAQ